MRNLPLEKRPSISTLKKKFKNIQLSELKKELDRVSAENQQMKSDPEGVIGKFLDDYNRALIQNNRLTAALCGYMKENTGSITVQKETVESFSKHRVTVNLAINDEDTAYTFTYTAEPVATETEVPTPS